MRDFTERLKSSKDTNFQMAGTNLDKVIEDKVCIINVDMIRDCCYKKYLIRKFCDVYSNCHPTLTINFVVWYYHYYRGIQATH